jgi:hypothetical protein
MSVSSTIDAIALECKPVRFALQVVDSKGEWLVCHSVFENGGAVFFRRQALPRTRRFGDD